MKFLYLLILPLLQIQATPFESSIQGSPELAVFVRGGLHANHYWASDHTALVEVSEAKERETDLQTTPAGLVMDSSVSCFWPFFRLPFLNLQKLQWTHLPLFVLLGNFRL